MKSILAAYIGKQINVVHGNSGNAVASGTLVAVADDYFVMETRWSDKQYFDLSKLSSFWCPDDKKNPSIYDMPIK
jgi:ferredoxin-fold anticodon binding domain-containing protein